MNYYTIYEKLLISLYFLCHLFFLQNKQYFSFLQVFGLFLLCFHEKRLILYRMVYTNKYKNPLMNSDGGVVIRGFFVSLFPFIPYILFLFRSFFYLMLSPASL